VIFAGVVSVIGGEPVDDDPEVVSDSESEQETSARVATHAIPKSLTVGLIDRI
jgi:hypothetical protein